MILFRINTQKKRKKNERKK